MDCRVGCSFWQLNKFLLTCFGLWPYQSMRSKYLSHLVLGVWMLSCFIPLIKGFAEETETDIVVVFESIVTLVIITGGVFLNAALCIHLDRIKMLYDQMVLDWEMVTEPDEVAILKNYSRCGKRLIITYIGTFSGGYAWFFSLTYVPILINNGVTTSYHRSIPYYANSWIISERFHILQVFLHENLGLLYAMFVYAATTSMYISSISHICGLYEIVCYRLKKLTGVNKLVKEKKVKDDDKVISEMLGIIAKHNQAIKSVRNVRMLFGPTVFVVEICILLTLAMFIFDFNYNMDRSILLPARIFFIALLFAEYLFYLNYGGQLIIEYSNKVLTSTYFMRWYLLSNDARKILLMILRRSNRGDELSAGIMKLSLEDFTRIIKLSWSFACVLLSSQQKYKMTEPQ